MSAKDHTEIASTSLDPDDWVAFRREFHKLVDNCIDHLEDVRNRPWRPPDVDQLARIGLGSAASGVGLGQMMNELVSAVLPYGSGNTHPRFFGWVQGTGNVAALAAELVSATMNSNCGGRSHGAVYVERDVINWCREAFGFPQTASGVIVTGTSQATVIALAVARHVALGGESRRTGMFRSPRLTAYASDQAHSSIVKAAELIGIGSDGVRMVKTSGTTGAMDMEALEDVIRRDRTSGCLPFCVIGTAGSVDTGAFDDLRALAQYCQASKLWLHVDGAFGAWLRIAGTPWSDLVAGIEHADSIACDFHKWMFVQYDCALVLIRDESSHRAAFAARPAYLAGQKAGVGGDEPWFCDYGLDLSRGFRANKIWATLRAYGSRALGEAIAINCELAQLMESRVAASIELVMSAPVRSNVCCFSVHPAFVGDPGAVERLNVDCVIALQMSGVAVFSTTTIDGLSVIRAAITNHRTSRADVIDAVDHVRAYARRVRYSSTSENFDVE